jgi:hypothetical protein
VLTPGGAAPPLQRRGDMQHEDDAIHEGLRGVFKFLHRGT